MKYQIRKQRIEDCKDVVHVITIAWNETYKGLVPDDILDNMYHNEDERLERAYQKFNNNDIYQFVLEIDNQIVGFINVGKSLDADYPGIGEIYALYIIGKYHGYGYGRKLMERGIKKLKELGYNEMIICCLHGNPTSEFYKHMGGVYVKSKTFERLNLPEDVYYYKKI